MNYQIPRRDCVIIPGLYLSPVNGGTRKQQFSDICGNAGLGGFGQSAPQDDAFSNQWRSGGFSGTANTATDKTLCSK